MYVCMYVCMYVGMYLCIYVSMYVSMYLCIYVCNVCMYVRLSLILHRASYVLCALLKNTGVPELRSQNILQPETASLYVELRGSEGLRAAVSMPY